MILVFHFNTWRAYVLNVKRGEYLNLRVRPVRFGNKPDRSVGKIIIQDKKDE
jgi:hypothetical protein